MAEIPCKNGRRSTSLDNAVHFVWRYIPLVDASASHVWATAGVECKLQPPMPISNYDDARGFWALLLSFDIKRTSRCISSQLKTCRLLLMRLWCCGFMKMLCCIKARASAKHRVPVIADDVHDDEPQIWQIRLYDRRQFKYADASKEQYLAGSLSWFQDAVETQVSKDTRSANLMPPVDGHSTSVLSNARATLQRGLHSLRAWTDQPMHDPNSSRCLDAR